MEEEEKKPAITYIHSYIVPSPWSLVAGVVDMHTSSVYLLVQENPEYREMTLVAIFDLQGSQDTCVMVKSGLVVVSFYFRNDWSASHSLGVADWLFLSLSHSSSTMIRNGRTF